MNLRQAKKIYKMRVKINKYRFTKARARLNKHHALGALVVPLGSFGSWDLDKFMEELNKPRMIQFIPD